MSEENKLAPTGVNKPERGRGGKHNFPSAQTVIESSQDRALVSQLLNELLVEYSQTKVTSDEELANRLNDYFKRCAYSGQIPTVEEMCLSTGYSYATCYDWEVGRNKGFSSETSKIIKKAKEMLKAFDAKLVVSGKMNFLAYCFRAKNYYGMTDKQEVVLTPNANQFGDSATPEELQKKYLFDSIADYDPED